MDKKTQAEYNRIKAALDKKYQEDRVTLDKKRWEDRAALDKKYQWETIGG